MRYLSIGIVLVLFVASTSQAFEIDGFIEEAS